MAGAFAVTGFWTAIGVMLLLVAIYLVLTHYAGAKSVLNAAFTGWQGTLSTLQGRAA